MKKHNEKKEACKAAILRAFTAKDPNASLWTKHIIWRLESDQAYKNDIPARGTLNSWLNELVKEGKLLKKVDGNRASWTSLEEKVEDELEEERRLYLESIGFESVEIFEEKTKKAEKIKLTLNQKACMIALRIAIYNYEGEPGHSDAGHDDVARLVGCSDRSAERYCDYLEAKNLIQRDNENTHDGSQIIYLSLLGRAYIEYCEIDEKTKVPQIESKKPEKVKTVQKATPKKKRNEKEIPKDLGWDKVIATPLLDSTIPKELVYAAWLAGVTDAKMLHDLVNDRVKLNSVRSWCSMWKKGRGLPRSAKK